MTIEQIIEELKQERDEDKMKCRENINNAEEYNFYSGRAIGISKALHWLNYLSKKEG